MWKLLIFSLLFNGVYCKFPIELQPNLDEECQQQMDEFEKSILTKSWPIKMYDSWTKWPSGVLEGNIRDPGNFDECINIKETYEHGTILGKYCYMGMVTLLKGIPVASSICIPDKCNPETLFVSSNEHNFTTQPQSCKTQETGATWTWDDWTVLGVLCFIALLMVISTIYDVYLQQNKLKTAHPAIISFSVLTNGKKMLASNNNPDQLHCLDGIRVISMMWIIAGHRFIMTSIMPLDNALEAQAFTSKAYSTYIQGSPVAVDTFFFLSAFLLSYMYFKNMKQGKKVLDFFGIPLFYFHRLFRITPALAALYFTNITIVRRMGTGPIWNDVFEMGRETCLKYWWSFWLYIQNYYNQPEMCMIQTWYLAADMQMFIIAPFIVLPLGYIKKNYEKIKAYMAASGVVLIAIFVPFIVNFWRELYNEHATHLRLSVYFIGIFMGMFIVDIKDKKNHINKYLNIAIWIGMFVGMGTILYYTMDDRYNLDDLDKKNYFHTFSRPGWALSVGWVVYACITGNGGFINWFLSRPIFQVGTRLCYSMYLIHSQIIMASMASSRTTFHFSDYTVIYQWCGDFIFSLLISTVWVLAFESPMIAIEKIMFGGGSKPPKPIKKSDDVVAVDTNEAADKTVITISQNSETDHVDTDKNAEIDLKA